MEFLRSWTNRKPWKSSNDWTALCLFWRYDVRRIYTRKDDLSLRKVLILNVILRCLIIELIKPTRWINVSQKSAYLIIMVMVLQGERPLITSRLVRHNLHVPLIKFFCLARQSCLLSRHFLLHPLTCFETCIEHSAIQMYWVTYVLQYLLYVLASSQF